MWLFRQTFVAYFILVFFLRNQTIRSREIGEQLKSVPNFLFVDSGDFATMQDGQVFLSTGLPWDDRPDEACLKRDTVKREIPKSCENPGGS